MMEMPSRLTLPLTLMLFGIFACAAQAPESGLVDGHLRPCPNSPNCLNSDTPGPAHLSPFPYSSSPAMAWQNLKQIIEETGGVIVASQPGYLRAVYTSRIWRFEDDVEFRLDEAASLIQVRSASRLGYWDLGVNRRRVERIRRLFTGLDERSGR